MQAFSLCIFHDFGHGKCVRSILLILFVNKGSWLIGGAIILIQKKINHSIGHSNLRRSYQI